MSIDRSMFPPVDQARRRFITVAAGASVGTLAVAAMPSGTTDSAACAADPIYAAIDAHRQARANYIRMIGIHSDLEEELPSEQRQSRVDAYGEEIAEGDDPRWIWSEREVMRLFGLGDQAAIDLINVQPTTIAGVLALLAYVIAVDEAEPQAWPEDLIDDDKKRPRDWSHFLHRNLADALVEMGIGARK